MADSLAIALVEKHLVTDQIFLIVGYDVENLTDPEIGANYKGDIIVDRFGRKMPKPAKGTAHLVQQTSSTRLITEAVLSLFERITDKKLLIRRINITANHVVDENHISAFRQPKQLDLFTDYAALKRRQEAEAAALEKEKKAQLAMIALRKKFGKNIILKGMNLEEGATTKTRNEQIGGHKS